MAVRQAASAAVADATLRAYRPTSEHNRSRIRRLRRIPTAPTILPCLLRLPAYFRPDRRSREGMAAVVLRRSNYLRQHASCVKPTVWRL